MTTWALAAGLALLALLPLLLGLRRAPALRAREESDRALYAAQRAELERERALGRLDEAAHAAALLEVQRRLLAVPEGPAPAPSAGGRGPVLAALVAVPALAFGLYALTGHPDLPSAPLAERRETGQQDEALLARLRERLEATPPESPAARQGWTLLAQVERGRGRPEAAAEAFRRALAAGFDAELAAQRAQVLIESRQLDVASAFLAESLPRAPGHVGLRFLAGLAEAEAGRPANARAAWVALLATAPEDAPWRGMVERRMQSLP